MDLHQSRGGMKSQRPGFHGVTPPAPGPRFPSKPAKSGDGATRAKPQMAKRTESREPPRAVGSYGEGGWGLAPTVIIIVRFLVFASG
jgi:hypothetical protein